MKRLTTSIAIAGLLTPLATHALGVGEIRLQSYLNQTLRAEIPLVLSRESLEDLRIQLASPRDFATAGLERPTILTKLRFRPERKADGGFVIRVASTEAIREPYLNFLVELAWPEGRMLKTFTVLLDPPDVLAATRYPEPMNAPVIDGNPDRPAFGAPAAAAHQPPPGDGPDYGPVGRNEKLWTIAQRVNPDPSAITTEQVVVALFRYNPEAFSRPSVNALNAGAMLRIPPLPYIQELSPATAREEFYRQQRGRPARWLGDAPTREAAAERMPENPVTSYRAPVPVPQAAAAPATLGDTSVKAVEALQRENAEMRKRLAELEKRVADLQVLFAERELLAANGQPQAQLSSGATKETITERAPPAAAAPSTQAIGEVQVEPAPSVLQPATPAPAPPATPATPAVAATDKTETVIPVVNQQPAPARESEPHGGATNQAAASSAETSLTAWLLGAAGTAVGTLIGLLYWQKRRARVAMTHTPEVTRETPVGATAEALAGRIDAARSEPEEVDPAFEADIYVSYGRYDQALETIETALRRHPGREAYELKLLDLLASQGNVARFQQEMDRLQSQPKPKAGDFWDKVRAIQERLPAMPSSPGAAPLADAMPAPDDTDRLIDEIKRFSLGVRGEADPDAGSPGDAPSNDPDMPNAARSDQQRPEIPWVPVPKTASEPSEPSVAAPVDSEHLIEFEKPPAKDNPPAEADSLDKDFDELASESIDSLLKELSALHYERHFQEDLPDKREASHAQPGHADTADGETATPGDASPQSIDLTSSAADLHLPALDLETKLDLARAYSDMGDYEQARQFLQEVISDGSAAQRLEAEALLASFAHH